MIKKILGAILIVIILLIAIGYCSGKRSSKTEESKTILSEVNTSLSQVSSKLTIYSNSIISVWNTVNNNGNITKQEMALITGVHYPQFVNFTKDYPEETYTDGLKAAQVQSAYYKNSGDLQTQVNNLENIKSTLKSISDKSSQGYSNSLNKYDSLTVTNSL